jgi:hypothetical protein
MLSDSHRHVVLTHSRQLTDGPLQFVELSDQGGAAVRHVVCLALGVEKAAVARHLRDRIRRLGATVEAEELPSGELIGRLNSGNYDLAIMGNIPDSPDPSDYLSAVVGSDAVPSGVEGASFAFNFARYRSCQVEGTKQGCCNTCHVRAGVGRWIVFSIRLYL